MDAASPDFSMKAARDQLIEQLRREISDQRVLKVMASVPREHFIPAANRHLAYEDRPLPIGEGQTISQPFIVALMTQALKLKGTEKVLELGTGSGYQAAILASLAKKVITVERVQSLAATAARTLNLLGYTNVDVYVAGRNLGWQAEAPYDAIIVTAGAPRIPQVLLDQLRVGGRMVIPVGSRWEQDLLQVTKKKDGFSVNNLTPCRFVPLIGEEAWNGE